jgi:hypothetical protein
MASLFLRLIGTKQDIQAFIEWLKQYHIVEPTGLKPNTDNKTEWRGYATVILNREEVIEK